jgi:hypothetical protein
MGEASAVPVAGRAAAVLLWIVAAGWGLPAPWLMWWVLVRGRLPVPPLIGEPNGGPFYFNYSRGTFVALLGASLLLAFAQAWAAWLLWAGKRSGALLEFGLLPVEAAFLVRLRSADPTASRHRPPGSHCVGLGRSGVGDLERWIGQPSPAVCSHHWKRAISLL